MNKNKIIGITGPIGAGKGVVAEHFIKKGFTHHSVRKFLEEEAKKRKLIPNRDVLVEIANELRKKHNPAYIVEQLYEQAKKNNKAIIESIRSPAEIELLRKKGPFILIAVTADKNIRYERIIKRNQATDNISFQEFEAHELREMENTDPYKQNINECIKRADYVIENNGSLEELFEKLDVIIKNSN